jgi:hemerythrin-like metal-binding protein
MEPFAWTADMELGLPQIDRSHRILVERIEAATRQPDGDFAAAYEDLIDALDAEFHAEDCLMDEIDFTAAHSHREQHARVMAALHQISTAEPGARRQALALLLPWFQLHLATMDVALAEAARVAAASEHGVARP